MSQGNRFGATKTKAAQVAQTPGFGGLYVQDTAAHDGNFSGILVLAAAVGRLDNCDIGGDTSAMVMPVGVLIPANFTRITLASGKVIAFYGSVPTL